MPLQAEELLAKMVEANEEGRETIRHLHEARSDALAVIKDWKRTIRDTITQEIGVALSELSTGVVEEMQTAVSAVIERIETDWRVKLGLNDD